MARNRNRKDVDDTLDVHGLTETELLLELQRHWALWRRLHTVRIVHGQGSVLKPAIERWCNDIGLPYLPDSHNPGALRIFPHLRTLPNTPLSTSLKERGLQHLAAAPSGTSEPAGSPRQSNAPRQTASAGLHAKLEPSASARRAAEAAKRAEEALWQAEISRLDAQDKGKRKPIEDAKPRPPVVIPALQLRYDEGYWKAELYRVADTDTETLQVQKRTGLDKLAPPMRAEKPAGQTKSPHVAKPPPQRDVAAEQALFEEEMARLGEFDTFEIKRAKSD